MNIKYIIVLRSWCCYVCNAAQNNDSNSIMSNRNEVMVTGLTPFLKYMFSITSQNKVSEMDDNVSNRTAVIDINTLEGGQLIYLLL